MNKTDGRRSDMDNDDDDDDDGLRLSFILV